MLFRPPGSSKRAIVAGLAVTVLALSAYGQEAPKTAPEPSPVAASEPLASAPVAAAPELAALTEQARQAFEKARGAVVRITASDDHGRLSGTGFLMDIDGTIFTAWSVIADNTDIEVYFDGKKYPAQRLMADKRSNLAVIKIKASADTPYLLAGRPSELAVAAPVIVVGYPLDLPVTPGVGFLAGIDYKSQDEYFVTPHLRANVSVQPGEQGAPLLNAKGEVVALLVARMESGNACFGLPITAARKVYLEYLRFGRPRPGWVGANFAARGGTFDDEGAEAVVSGVATGSPAEKAGIENGDVLLELDGLAIKRPADVFSASFFLTGGDPVFVKVRRNGEVRTLEVVPVVHPSTLVDPGSAWSSEDALLYRPLQLRR